MSDSLSDLQRRLDEVRLLTGQDPERVGRAPNRSLSNALSRSCLVLLSAHLEGYLEDVAVEAIDYLTSEAVAVERLPLLFRALHAEEHLRDLEPMKDRNARAPRIERLFAEESALWGVGMSLAPGMVRAVTVCAEMDNPGSKEIKRFLQLIGVDDIDDYLSVSGAPGLLGQVNGLVAKRNAIAHGELSALATYGDVDNYVTLVDDLARHVDRAIAFAVQSTCQTAITPWAI